jgi:hypothetical protein
MRFEESLRRGNCALRATSEFFNRIAEKHSADFGRSAAAPPQIADLHCFEIHRSSQSSAVPRSLLKTTFAHDWLCSSMRSDFLGQIWGNLGAKPCPSMPIRPQRGDGRHQPNLLLQKKKVDIWQRTESVSQHNGGVSRDFFFTH